MRRFLASLRCFALCDLCKPIAQAQKRELEKLRKEIAAKDDASRYTHRAYVEAKEYADRMERRRWSS